MDKKHFSLLTLSLIITVVVIGQTPLKKETLIIPEGKVGLIGYGSLMSKEDMEKTLGHPYLEKYLKIHIDGFERIWNCAELNGGINRPYLNYFIMKRDTIFPKHLLFLNIQPKKTKAMNACLFIIDTVELKMFDKAEYGYKRINLNDRIKEFDIVRGNVFAYIALPDFTIVPTDNPRDNIILKGYVKVVEEDGLLSMGEDFRNEYYATTVPYPQKILISRKDKLIKK